MCRAAGFETGTESLLALAISRPDADPSFCPCSNWQQAAADYLAGASPGLQSEDMPIAMSLMDVMFALLAAGAVPLSVVKERLVGGKARQPSRGWSAQQLCGFHVGLFPCKAAPSS